MDITDAEATRKVIGAANVDAVIHCAAYTAVDAAEDHVETCRNVNVDGTRNIAEVWRYGADQNDLYQYRLCV